MIRVYACFLPSIFFTVELFDLYRSSRYKNYKCRIDLRNMHCSTRLTWILSTQAPETLGALKQLLPSVCQVQFQSTTTTNDRVTQPFENVPGPSGIYSWSYIGLPLQMKPFTKYKDFRDRVEQWHKDHGDIFKQKLGKAWSLFLFDPSDIETVLREDGKYPLRPQLLLSKRFDELNNQLQRTSLASLNGEEWRQIRLAAQQKMLRPAAVKSYVPLIDGVADDLIETLKEKDKIEDTVKTLMAYATESVGMLCFNKRLGCLAGTSYSDELMFHVRHYFKLFGEHFYHPVQLYKWFRTPFYRKFEKSSRFIYSVAQQNINEALERIKHSKEEGEEPNLLRDLILDERIGPVDTQRILITLFSAGIESTANNTACFLFQLAKHPDVQEKLYREVKERLPEGDQLDSSTLDNMPYLVACVKESLRLISPIMLGPFRITQKEMVLHNYQIPKYTIVRFCNMFACTDEIHFSEPMKFKPERWLRDEEGKRNIHPFLLLPFGFGPRNCLGQRFALQEIYICTIKLLKKFRLKLPAGKEELKYGYKTFVTPLHPIEILLEKRNN